MDRSKLLELAERCEQATGPDRELNIALLPLVGLRFVDEGHPIGEVCYEQNNHAVPMPRFTASLDAAMTLVPEGFAWEAGFCEGKHAASVSSNGNRMPDATICATVALALCAAALKARAQSQEPK